MRHLHAADADVPGGVPRPAAVARATAVNTVAVLSRADEIGGGRVDAMFSARAVAAALPGRPGGARAVPERRRGGRAARRDRAARCARPSTPRSPSWPACRATELEPRAALGRPVPARHRPDRDGRARAGVDRSRAAAPLRAVRDPAVDLADPPGRGRARPRWPPSWSRRSGLQRAAAACCTRQFAERRDLLKARSALLAVDSVLRARPAPGRPRWPREVERILAGAHEFTELRLLGRAAVRRGALPRAGRRGGRAAARRRGAAATPPGSGLPADASRPAELRRAAFAALERWQRHAVEPDARAGRPRTPAGWSCAPARGCWSAARPRRCTRR